MVDPSVMSAPKFITDIHRSYKNYHKIISHLPIKVILIPDSAKRSTSFSFTSKSRFVSLLLIIHFVFIHSFFYLITFIVKVTDFKSVACGHSGILGTMQKDPLILLFSKYRLPNE